MRKKTIAVLFGGQSSEHEVSCISVGTILSNINEDDYEILTIGITKDGRWLKVDSPEDIPSGKWKDGKVTAVLSPDASQKGVLLLEGDRATLVKVDVVFPVLHGPNGEDGTIQGLLELAKIPYVGCGVLASAVSMDKLYTKTIVDRLHIRQAKFTLVLKSQLQDMDLAIKRVEEAIPYPVFVKPSNAGSSRGVSRAEDREGLKKALLLAADHDKKILVEETIVGREVECAVLGSSEPRATGVGEILAAAEFYDYDAKYNSPESRTVLSPDLPEGVAEEIAKDAVDIFQAVSGFGLSRVDFFVEEGSNQVVFNEINTMPGFTSISMYPMLWEEKGMGRKELVEKLIQLAFHR